MKDLQEVVDEVKEDPEKYKHGSTAMYGMAHHIPDVTLLEPIVKSFVDDFFTA